MASQGDSQAGVAPPNEGDLQITADRPLEEKHELNASQYTDSDGSNSELRGRASLVSGNASDCLHDGAVNTSVTQLEEHTKHSSTQTHPWVVVPKPNTFRRRGGFHSTKGHGMEDRGPKETTTSVNRLEIYKELRYLQNLSSIINVTEKGDNSWSTFWMDIYNSSVGDFGALPSTAIDLETQSFDTYLHSVEDAMKLFEENTRWHKMHFSTKESSSAVKRNSREMGTSTVTAFNKTTDDAMKTLESENTFNNCFEKVPPIYFDQNYGLTKQPLFRQPLPQAVAHQEELSWYLDLVEMTLFDQVTRRYNELMEAFSDISCYANEMHLLLTNIKTLRASLKAFEKQNVTNGIQILLQARRRDRMLQVIHRLELIASLRQTFSSLSLLLSSQDYVTSVRLLEASLSILNSELKGLAVGRAIASRLEGIGGSLDSLLSAEFLQQSIQNIFVLDELAESVVFNSEMRCIQKIDWFGRRWTFGWIELEEHDRVMEGDSNLSIYDKTILHRLRGDSERLKAIIFGLIERRRINQVLQSLRDHALKYCRRAMRNAINYEVYENSKLGDSLQGATGSTSRQTSLEDLNGFEEEEDSIVATSASTKPPVASMKAEQIEVSSALNYERFSLMWVHLLGYLLCIVKALEGWSYYVYQHSTKVLSNEAVDGIEESERCLTTQQDTLSHVTRLTEVIVYTMSSKLSNLLKGVESMRSAISYKELGTLYWRTVEAVRFVYTSQERLLFNIRRMAAERNAPNSTIGHRLTGTRLSLSSPTAGLLKGGLLLQAKRALDTLHAQAMTELRETTRDETFDELSSIECEELLQRLTGDTITVYNKRLHIDGKQFPILSSVWKVLCWMDEYYLFVQWLPLVSLEVLNCMAYFVREFIRFLVQAAVGGVVKEGMPGLSAVQIVLVYQVMEMLSCILNKFEKRLHQTLTNGEFVVTLMETQTSILEEVVTSGSEEISLDEGVKVGASASTNDAYDLLNGIRRSDVFKSPVGIQMGCILPETSFAASSNLKEICDELMQQREKIYKRLGDILLERLEVQSVRWLSTPHFVEPATQEIDVEKEDSTKLDVTSISVNQQLLPIVEEHRWMYEVLSQHFIPSDISTLFYDVYCNYIPRFEETLLQCFGVSSSFSSSNTIIRTTHAVHASLNNSIQTTRSHTFVSTQQQQWQMEAYLMSGEDVGSRLCMDLLSLYTALYTLPPLKAPLQHLLRELLDVLQQSWKIDDTVMKAIHRRLGDGVPDDEIQRDTTITQPSC